MKRLRENEYESPIIKALKEGISALSVSKVTSSKDLLCRNVQMEAIITFLESSNYLTLQIFGMPGTGKTATVHSALAKMSSSSNGKLSAILLNGYVVQKSTDIYWTMYTHFCQTRFITNKKCSSEKCAEVINNHFTHGWKRECKLCVIVIDEVDKLLEKHSKAFFKVVDWLSQPYAKCKLITISNSMQLPYDLKTLSRVDNTMQLVFFPYGLDELKTIFMHRIGAITPQLFTEEAINFLCLLTSNQCGDVRRLLQAASSAICNVLIRLRNKKNFIINEKEGIISMEVVYPIVRKVFQDRFVEFIKSVQNPTLYIVICIIAKESENKLRHRENEPERDCRILLDRIYKLTLQTLQTTLMSLQIISKIAFYDLITMLREVALIDISYGNDCIPLHCTEDMMLTKEEVYISIIQPYQTIIDLCKFHGVFGNTIGARIL